MKKLFLFLFCVFSISGYAQNSSSSFDPYWYKGHTFGIATNLVSSPDSKYKGLKPKTKTYLDQAFDNAIEGDDGRLCAKIDVKKKIKYDDIVAYINDQNTHTTVTIMGNNATMTGVRLDPHDPKAIVTTVLFLKKGNYKNYALKKLAECAKSKVITNGTNADAYILFPEEEKPTQVFSQNNVVWNGNISKGKISGRGQGYYYNNGSIIYFVGFFIDGYPSYPSGCHFYQYSISEDEVFQGNKVKDKSAMVKDFGEGLAAFYTTDYDFYGFINQFGKMVIKPQYKNIVESFHNGKAVVYDDKRHSNIIINTNGDFVDYDEKYIYDKKINNAAVKSYSLLSSTGKGMFFNADNGINGTMIDNFKWSGEVVDGMINGNGTGFAKKGKKYYYVSGTFVNGFPFGDVVFQELNLTSDDLNAVKAVERRVEFGELSEGMAFIRRKKDVRFSLVTEYGKMVVYDEYYKCKPFENGKAEVFKDGKEIIIDKTGEFVDYTAHQKELDKAEAEAAEQERIAAQKAELARKNQTRIEELNKEWDDLVKKCTEKCMEEWKHTSLVGREVAWEENITYDISNGNQGLVLNLLSSALGQNSVTYKVRFTAILESYIGTNACKVIISRADIQDPNWASANYIKYRKAAVNDVNKNLGQTRVKQLNEIYEQTPVTQEEIESFGQKFLQSPEGKKINKRIEEIKAELKKLQGE